MKIKLVEAIKHWAYINSRELGLPLLSMLREQEKELEARIEREMISKQMVHRGNYIPRPDYEEAYQALVRLAINDTEGGIKGYQMKMVKDVLKALGIQPKEK